MSKRLSVSATAPTSWPERPFDPACKTKVIADPGVIDAIRLVVKDFSLADPNWVMLRAYFVVTMGLDPAYVRSMTLREIRGAFDSGQAKMIAISGALATDAHFSSILQPAAVLHPTTRAVKALIDANPGQTADQIAKAVGVGAERVRTIMSETLAPLGYHNPKGGAGYFPPR